MLPTTLQTERLRLCVPRPGEGGLVNMAIVESWPELSRWLTWAKTVPTIDETEARAKTDAVHFAAEVDYAYVLWTVDSSMVVGKLGLHVLHADVPSFEIGYWCRTRFTGQGLMTEAVRAVTEAAFTHLGAQRLEIRCDPRNMASRRVAERSGFTREAHLHHEQRAPDGSLRDTLIYTRFPST